MGCIQANIFHIASKAFVQPQVVPSRDKNNFNPYMSAPQKFQEDHESLKAEMYLAIERSQIKIIAVALAIVFASVLLFK